MYCLYKETTKDWSTPVKNHIYMLSKDKQWLYGMVIGNDLKVFKNRMKFDTRYRTFKLITNKDMLHAETV